MIKEVSFTGDAGTLQEIDEVLAEYERINPKNLTV